jgi:hypothetical protein
MITESPKSENSISAIIALLQDIDVATKSTRVISHWNTLTVYGRLKRAEASCSELESRVDKVLSEFERTRINPVLELQMAFDSITARIKGEPFTNTQAQKIVNAINGMSHSFLLVNSLQQKMQGLRFVIERKYALAFGFACSYIGVSVGLIGIVLAALPLWHGSAS